MTTGASTTDYVLDGTMAVQDVVNGAVAATYLAGPRGPEYRRDDETGAVRWYVYDGLGSVVGEAAPDGSLTCTRKLDVYGCVRSSSGTATSKHKFVGSLGHPSDDETGLIYMRARHYDPVTGRFVSEDPGRNGTNWLVYCSDDPVNCRDNNGKMSKRDIDWWTGTLQNIGAGLLTFGFTAALIGAICFYSSKAGPAKVWGSGEAAITFYVGCSMVIAGALILELSHYVSGMTPDEYHDESSMIVAYLATVNSVLQGAGFDASVQPLE